jgi:5-methylcytosine-specific restriction endonuclease McrA
MNARRKQGEENYRRKFEEFGLSECFEFLGRIWEIDRGRKVIVRCKECGQIFETWNVAEIFKGKLKHLPCIFCGATSDGNDIWERSAKCDEAMDYYIQGHTVSETAEKFGVSKSKINGSVKTRGLSNGRQWGQISPERLEQIRKDAEQKIIDRLDDLGFDYIGGYTDASCNIKIRCRVCEDEFERSADFVKRGNLICRKCEHEKALRRQEAEKQVRKDAVEIRKIVTDWERLMRPSKDHYKEIHEDFLDRSGICEICGEPYTVREYAKSCGTRYARDGGVCSKECRDIKAKRSIRISHKGRRDSHRHRAKKFGCEYDPSVKLEKLIKRDGLQCKICGKMCNLNDHAWTEWSGPTYPSIDHIIPMVKGGGHTWDNVQIAHIICNSRKGVNHNVAG